MFTGDASDFRQWVFSLELAMESQKMHNPRERAQYACSYIGGKAQLWLIATLEGAKNFESWEELKDALRTAFGPLHEQEQARLSLLGMQQTGKL